MRIPFNKPYVAPGTLEYVRQAFEDGRLSGGGRFTEACHRALTALTGCQNVLLTQSGTTALEMCALLLDLEPGDEVIMPSWTFPSTANAFVLRGAVPVFVDIRPDTLNIDEALVEEAITPKTRAIVVVHYAGVPCEMDAIDDIASRHGLVVVEDAAQALGSRYKGRPAGTLGHLAAFSFHATKNIGCGEGGALLVNDSRFIQAAEEIWDKGTNRAAFLRGEVDAYEWTRTGSSCLPSEITAAVLYAQLLALPHVQASRMELWEMYRASLQGRLPADFVLPNVPVGCAHSAHIFHLRAGSAREAHLLKDFLSENGLEATMHYHPLHLSVAGQRLARHSRVLPVSENTAETLLRLPMWTGMTKSELSKVSDAVQDFSRRCR